MKSTYFGLVGGALLAIMAAGCGGSSSAATGTLGVNLTDAPAEFDAVFVTVDRVAVHRADDTNDSNESQSGWITVAQPHGTYDLLTLRDGNLSELGITTIPATKYTQMRLYLSSESNDSVLYPYGNYVVIGGVPYEMTVPSMVIKENNNFVMAPDGNMTMTIDFDANASVHATGGGDWMLKPVLHVKTD